MKIEPFSALFQLFLHSHEDRGYDDRAMAFLQDKGYAIWTGDRPERGVWKITRHGEEAVRRAMAAADGAFLEHLQEDWYVAQLPDGDWGLFEWRPEVQTMEHIDTQPFCPAFDFDAQRPMPPADIATMQAYHDAIVELLVTLHDKSCKEARALLKQAITDKLVAPFPLLTHETCEFWANVVATGRRDFWRTPSTTK